MPKAKPLTVPKPLQSLFDEIAALTDSVCLPHLNEEYAHVCRAMIAALLRKRPSPLLRGRNDVWAAAIVHAVGTVNFLHDRSTKPYMSLDDLAGGFNTSKSTVSAKSAEIRRLLKVSRMEATWMLPSRIESSSIVWLIMVNGIIVDARSMPLELQEIAHRKGLIPYVPALQSNPNKSDAVESSL